MSSKTKHFLISSLVLVVLSCGAYGGLWYAIVLRTNQVYERMNGEATKVERQKSLAALTKALAGTKEDREALQQFIITDDQVTDFLGLVESSARSQGLSISTKSVTVAPLSEDTSFDSLSLTLEVAGPFLRVSTFLSLLETLPFQTRIDSVSLERTSDKEGDLWKGIFILQATKKKAL